jgi:hypothetical protein
MMRRKILVSMTIMFWIVSAIIIALPPKANAGTYIIFSEDFEGDFPDTQWEISDENSEYGIDYWGTTSYKCRTGSKSAWCAQMGTNRWDYVEVWVFSGDTWVEKWEQPSVDSDGWQNVDIGIPTTTTYILFHFTSDGTVGWGPYEGVYVDDIVVTGVDVTKPTITITRPSADSIVTSSDVSISWIGSDDTSGIERYEVKLDSGSWMNIGNLNSTTLNNIGDGSHSVTVRAFDEAENYDDASVTFTVDTNPFSMSGPYKGLPLFLLIFVIIIAVVIILWIVLRKKVRFEE